VRQPEYDPNPLKFGSPGTSAATHDLLGLPAEPVSLAVVEEATGEPHRPGAMAVPAHHVVGRLREGDVGVETGDELGQLVDRGHPCEGVPQRRPGGESLQIPGRVLAEQSD